MVKRTARNLGEVPLPNLIVPRDSAKQKIKDQIEKGQKLNSVPINSQQELEKLRAERSRWSSYNTELLKRLFDNTSIADEYNRFYGGVLRIDSSFSELIDDFRDDMNDSINRLESIFDRLELIPEKGTSEIAAGDSQSTNNKLGKELGKDIFIVHGHDEAAKEAASRLIERLELKAIILHEQPNASKTVLEKFEIYSNVGFAIVLLTPDDVGASKERKSEGKPRARQNVIFELGYFIGKLGRDRVCALYKEVELPSDIHGVLYIPIDSAGAWRYSVAKELQNVGFPIDMNKI